MTTKVISKKRQRTAEKIIQAISESQGLLTVAAKKSGYNYVTVWKYTQEFPAVRQAVVEAKERMIDYAEGKLYQNIQAGDNTAIIFYLKTQAKHRGFIERQELTGAEGQPIKTEAKVVHFDAGEVARAILEAQKLGLNPELLGGNGHSEDASLLPAQTNIQATPVSEP